MIEARGRALLLLAATTLIAAVGCRGLERRGEGKPAPAERPTLLLLTSLPLVFGEDFSLSGNGSPALKALERDYRVVPISVSSAGELAKGRLLLAAHPRAQPAQDLVALDRWVRDGGRVLLLADPLLQWPSKRPLGDPLRPPPMFADTGLLAHWGLRLDPADPADAAGEAMRSLGGRMVRTIAPGVLSGRCALSGDRLVARCPIGKGQATVVADADFLNVAALGRGAEPNLDALLAELATLRRR